MGARSRHRRRAGGRAGAGSAQPAGRGGAGGAGPEEGGPGGGTRGEGGMEGAGASGREGGAAAPGRPRCRYRRRGRGPERALRAPVPCGTDWDPGPGRAGARGGGGAGGRGRARRARGSPQVGAVRSRRRPSRLALAGWPAPAADPRVLQRLHLSLPHRHLEASSPPGKRARSPRLLRATAERRAGSGETLGSHLRPFPARSLQRPCTQPGLPLALSPLILKVL